MRKIISILAAVLITASVFAQAPEKMSYQAVVRDGNNALVTNTQVGMQISIIEGSAFGTVIYVETHDANTNDNGLVSVKVGTGTVQHGAFTAINWESNRYFIKTEFDLTGGINYTITGTSEFMSVPYAIHAKTAESITGGITETDPVFNAWDKDYADLTNTPTIPTVPVNVGDFTNDAGYLTEYSESDPQFNAWDKDYADLTNTPTIPTVPVNVSDFTNDAGYLTEYSETDPQFSAWDKSTDIVISESQISDLDHFTNADETDPQFSAWDKSTDIVISESQISDLDHFTNADETDPVFNAWDKDYADLTNTPTTITTAQANAIVANTAKVGYTDALVSSNADVVANTAKISAATGTQAGEMQYWNGSEWITVAAGDEGQMLSFVGGVPTWTTVVATTDVYNPITEKIWMDRNLGATRVATSVTDADSYGDLYQWGRAADGHESRTSNTTATLSSSDTPGHGDFIEGNIYPYDWRQPQNHNLWQGVSGTNNPCPSGYRLPTKAEWQAEVDTWSNGGIDGAFASLLKLPAAGSREYDDGSLYKVGEMGCYWSSTVVAGNRAASTNIANTQNFYAELRAYALSVRCIKD
ncbi:MAG: FISUMP domain-containing protein [Bacteroidales bacterium]|nr:FISUMP domain-containing protein [Bacteroidales bacterium]